MADLSAFFNARALTSDGPIAYRVFGPDGGPDGSGLFPKTSRFIDLLVGGDGAFAYQKAFGARESFTVRDLAISLDSRRTKIVDDDGLIVEEIATHHGDCPPVAYRISYKGVAVVFSGDMDASALPNLVQLAKSADLLVFNCAVLDPPDSPFSAIRSAYPAAGNWASRAGQWRKKIVAEPSRTRCRRSEGHGAEIDPCVLCRGGCFRNGQVTAPCTPFSLGRGRWKRP